MRIYFASLCRLEEKQSMRKKFGKSVEESTIVCYNENDLKREKPSLWIVTQRNLSKALADQNMSAAQRRKNEDFIGCLHQMMSQCIHCNCCVSEHIGTVRVQWGDIGSCKEASEKYHRGEGYAILFKRIFPSLF